MGSKIMEKVQRFGGAMFTPVLLFAFAGIMVGISSVCKNTDIVGALANETTLWFKIWSVVESGSWTIFKNMPLVFVVALPIGLAKKQNARACLEALVIFLTFNYFLNQIFTFWGDSFGVVFESGRTGITTVAGIQTLDMGMIGAILISSIVVYIHNRFFDTELPEFLGIFKGSTFVYMICFFVMIPVAFLVALIWPKVQMGISSMQNFIAGSGTAGVGIYAFLNRILIPTGLHHFVYSPFQFDNLVVDGGIASYWMQHLNEFANSTKSLKELFPQGGFALYGMEKMFGSIGIALAIYSTARKENRKKVAGLLIPATLTAVLCGVTEPLEFTFLFEAPVLFLVHSILSALLDMTCYIFGVVGYFVGGGIEFAASNWIPLGASHGITYVIQFIIGFVFIGIYVVVFRFLILKFNFRTPGREEQGEETKLFTKADYKEKKAAEKGSSSDDYTTKAQAFLDALGGKDNISEVNNCATRLRVSVKDESLVQDPQAFKSAGAHGAVINGTSIQIIIGLKVVRVREEFEKLL
ncbi:alpha-glucoside-specific PTS transporter subunit IIBC [Anaerosacchariphilus polymeriproducens]|uniref:alpha-glucoside-specific PTS transporter subunit IIBC n=1 Tax=Anaerosacchariphilus polymeriproducens TaxID=1812858 RepID=UPI00267998A7